RTFSRVRSLTMPFSLSARETVILETPASAAMSAMVTGASLCADRLLLRSGLLIGPRLVDPSRDCPRAAYSVKRFYGPPGRLRTRFFAALQHWYRCLAIGNSRC